MPPTIPQDVPSNKAPQVEWILNSMDDVAPMNTVPVPTRKISDKASSLSWILDAMDDAVGNKELTYKRQEGIDTTALTKAIVGQESGDDYGAISKHTDSHGNRAYGRYQILASNIPVWTKEVLGRTMTPQQFLKDTAAQDAVFNWHIGNLIKKYNNINDIASVYFSGGLYEKNKAKKDASGLTVEQYAQSLNDRYNKLAGKDV